MSEESTATPFRPSLWRRVLIYLPIWSMAAFILASRAELYLDDDRENIIHDRVLVFVGTPVVASMGLDFAMISAMHLQDPEDSNQAGGFTLFFLLAFVLHAYFTLSSSRPALFIVHIGIFVILLSLGVFYALRLLHIYATTGHG